MGNDDDLGFDGPDQSSDCKCLKCRKLITDETDPLGLVCGTCFRIENEESGPNSPGGLFEMLRAEGWEIFQ